MCRLIIVVHHILLAQRARAAHGHQWLFQIQRSHLRIVQCRLRNECHRRFQPAAESAEHRPVMHGLRCRNRGIGIAHRRGGDKSAFDNQRRLHAEKGRLPQHQIGELADFNRADGVRDAVRERRIDRVLGDVALDAKIVVADCIFLQRARAASSFCARSARCE